MEFYRQSDLRKIPRPKFLIKDYLIERSLAQLSGPSGVGKTFIYTDWACTLARAGRRILLLLGEGFYSYQDRLDAWKIYHGLDVPDDNLIVARGVPSLPDKEQVFAVIEKVRDVLREMGGTFDLIIVDTWAKAMAGWDENYNPDITAALANLTELRRVATNSASLLITHFGWSEMRQRGGSALFGECDSVLYLERVERKQAQEDDDPDSFGYLMTDVGPKSKRARLKIAKHRDYRDDLPAIFFERVDVDLGYLDEDGRPVTSCVYERVKKTEKVVPRMVDIGGEVIDITDRTKWTS